MKKLNKFFLLPVLIAVLVFTGCQPERKESATKGSLKCLADESLYSIVAEIRDTFVSRYRESKIELEKVKAREGIVKVLNGESTMFVSSRELNKEEVEFIQKTKADIRIMKFCYDAITVVVDSNHSLNKMTTTELKQILLGKSKQYRVFIPDQNSGIFENLKNDLLENQNPQATIVNSEEEVIKSVLKSKNSIGIVGLNIARSSKGIKVVKIGTDERSATGGEYYEPVAGYLSNGEYPLIRTCYIILNEIGIFLGSGFSTFITSRDGQKIVLDHDLGPATVPIRYKQTMRLK